jgi:ABC-type dipeptide/oligopeptide/nickel transport system ATPase component
LAKKEMMKYTTVKISEIRQHPTMRLDPGYWIKKKKKIKKAASLKLQAPSSVDNGSGIL